MTITYLGAKRLQGTKFDRVNDSLGSSVDGVNTGVTLVSGKEITWTSSGSTTTFNSVTKSASSAGWTNNYAHSQSYSSGILIVEFDPNVGQGYGSLCGIDDGTNNGDPTDITLGMAGLTQATNNNTIISGTATDQGSGSWASGDIMKIEYNIDSGAYAFYKNGSAIGVSGTLTGGAKPSSVRVLVSSYSQNYKVTDIAISGSATTSTATVQKLGTGAYSFDGSDDYVIAGSASDWTFLSDGSNSTVAFWYKRDGTQVSSEPCIIDTNGATQSNVGTCIYSATNGALTYYTASGSANKNVSLGTPTDGEWTHLAVVNDGSNLTSYVNGTQEAQTSLSGYSASSSNPSTAYNIGRNGRSGNLKYIKGVIDDMGIFKRALSATEIGKLVNNNGHTRSTYRMGGLITAKNNLVFSAPTGQRGGYTSGYGGDTTIWDLGQTLSANFVARFELKLDNYSINSNWQASNGFGLWLSNNESDGIDTAQQWITLVGHWAQNGSGYIGTKTSTSAPENALTSSSGISSNSATTYYCQLTKNGDNITFTRTTNSDYTTGTSSHAITGGNSVSGLRYLKLSGTTEYRSGQFPNGTVDGQITNLKIDDNTTTWSSADITPTVDNPAQLVSSLTDKSELKAYYSMDNDLRIPNLSLTTKYVARWKMKFTALTGNAVYWEMGMSDSTGERSATQFFEGLHMRENSYRIAVTPASTAVENTTGTYMSGTESVTWNTTDTYYFELIRNDASFTLNLYTADDYSTGKTTLTLTITSGTWGATTLSALMRYFRIITNNSQTDTGHVYDFQFWNDKTSATGTADYTSDFTSCTTDGNCVGWDSSDTSKFYVDVSDDKYFFNLNASYKSSNFDLLDPLCKNDFSSTSNLDAMTNLPVNTIFEQTDDTPKYFWKQSDNTWKIDGTTGFLTSGNGLHVGGNATNTSTFTATNYVWGSGSVATIGESRTYSAGAGNKNSFWIAGGSNAHTSRIFDGSSWSSTTALDTERRDTTAGGGSTSNAIIACGRNQSGTEISSSSKYNGTSWSSAGTVTGGAGEHVGGSGTGSSFLATGGSTRNDKCDKYDGTSWSASAVLPQTTVRSHNQAGNSSASAHTAGGNYASSFTWNGTSWSTSTNYVQGGDTTVRYPTGGGTAEHHWIMGGLDEAGGSSALDNTELWNGSTWTAKGALPTANYAGVGDGSDF